MQVTFPKWSKLINQAFIPLIQNTDRYLICYGGRGSSKSDAMAKKLIYRCLSEKYFRYILYRETYNTIKDSQFQTIKDIVTDLGLESLFTFNVSPLEIRCINGNKFFCRGGDEPKKLKSIKDPTGVWYEEEIPPEGDFITISTSIRTTKATYLQEVFTINPEVEGDYNEHYFYKRFFKDKPEGTFRGETVVDIGFGKMFTTSYTAHHSTYNDNKWLPDSFKAQLLELARSNPYYYTIYALGKWGNKSTDGNFYKLFKRERDVLPVIGYNPHLPLHLSFDFNVHPYVTITIYQAEGKLARCIDEICLPTPDNRTDIACRRFAAKYQDHTSGVYIYGDPAGKHEDTRTEQGFNDFRIIAKELEMFRPVMRVLTAPPAVHMAGMFINAIFDCNTQGIDLKIAEKCTNLISDMLYLKEASDGTKSKAKVKNPDTGVTYEKYGHTSDSLTYLICMMYAREYEDYKTGNIVRKPLFAAPRNARY